MPRDGCQVEHEAPARSPQHFNRSSFRRTTGQAAVGIVRAALLFVPWKMSSVVASPKDRVTAVLPERLDAPSRFCEPDN